MYYIGSSILCDKNGQVNSEIIGCDCDHQLFN